MMADAATIVTVITVIPNSTMIMLDAVCHEVVIPSPTSKDFAGFCSQMQGHLEWNCSAVQPH